MTQVWVLTDERYLEQRMPRLLVDELRARGLATRTLVTCAGGAVRKFAGSAPRDRIPSHAEIISRPYTRGAP